MIRLRSSLSALIVLSIVSITSRLYSQATTDLSQHLGIDPYGTYTGSQADHIDMRSGNLSAQIPLFTLPQKGRLNLGFHLVLNNNGWTVQSSCDNYGCANITVRSSAVGPQILPINDHYVNSYPLNWQLGVLYQPICDDTGDQTIAGAQCIAAGTNPRACSDTNTGTLCSINTIIGYNIVDSDGASHALIEDASNVALLHSYDGSELMYTPTFNRPFDLWSGITSSGNNPNPPTEAYINRGFLTSSQNAFGSSEGRAPGTITDSSGISYYYPPNNKDPYDPGGQSSGDSLGPEIISDTNGNQITITPYWQSGNPSYFSENGSVNSSQMAHSILVDSVGRTFNSPPDPTISTVGCPTITDPGQTSVTKPNLSSTWAVPGPNGTVTYLICYEAVTINTNFQLDLWTMDQEPNDSAPGDCPPGQNTPGYPGGSDSQACNAQLQASGSIEAIQSIVLPNRTFWGFSYNPPSASDAGQYGDISQIILPTGGSIQYTYLPQNPYQGNLTRVIASRTESPAAGTVGSPATWHYGWTLDAPYAVSEGGCGPAAQVANASITSPDGTITNYSFSPSWCGTPGREVVTSTGLGGETETMTTNYFTTCFVNQQLNTAQITSIAWPFYWVQASPWAGYCWGVQTLPSTIQTSVSSGGSSYSVTSKYSYDIGGSPAKELYCNTPFAADPYESYSVPDNCASIATTTTPDAAAPVALGSRTGVLVTGTNGQFLHGETTTYQWQQTGSSYYALNLLDRPYQGTILSGSPNSDGSYVNVPIAAQTNYTYDESAYNSGGSGNLTTLTKVNQSGSSATSHLYYNTQGYHNESVDPNGNLETVSGFDCSSGSGTVNSVAAYQQTTVAAFGSPVAETATTMRDCNTGAVLQSTDTNSQTTTTAYDAGGNPTLIVYPDTASTTFNYNGYAIPLQVTKQIAPTRPSSTYADGFGRTIKSIASSGAETDTTYDLMGRVASVSNPYFSTLDSTYGITTFSYDGLSRKTRQVDSDGVSTQNWSYIGPAVTYKDENSNQWLRTYDEMGRLIKVIEPGSLNTTYQYDVLSNLLCVDQWGTAAPGTACASARPRSFTYDSLSRLTGATNPEAGTIGYTYDANGNPLAKTSPLANASSGTQTVNYQYDALNRLVQKSYAVLPAAVKYSYSCYQYDATSNPAASSTGNFIGRLTNSWTQINSSSTFTCPFSPPTGGALSRRSILAYDPMGRLKSDQQCTAASCGGTVFYTPSYTYDLAGNTLTQSNGLLGAASSLTFTSSYDAAGRLVGVSSNNTRYATTLFSVPSSSASAGCSAASSVGYSPAGSLQNAVLGVGLQLTRTYDSRLRINCETDIGNSASNPTPGTAKIIINGTDQP